MDGLPQCLKPQSDRVIQRDFTDDSYGDRDPPSASKHDGSHERRHEEHDPQR